MAYISKVRVINDLSSFKFLTLGFAPHAANQVAPFWVDYYPEILPFPNEDQHPVQQAFLNIWLQLTHGQVKGRHKSFLFFQSLTDASILFFYGYYKGCFLLDKTTFWRKLPRSNEAITYQEFKRLVDESYKVHLQLFKLTKNHTGKGLKELHNSLCASKYPEFISSSPIGHRINSALITCGKQPVSRDISLMQQLTETLSKSLTYNEFLLELARLFTDKGDTSLIVDSV